MFTKLKPRLSASAVFSHHDSRQLLGVGLLLLMLACLLSGYAILRQGAEEGLDAWEQGQFVEIEIETGKVHSGYQALNLASPLAAKAPPKQEAVSLDVAPQSLPAKDGVTLNPAPAKALSEVSDQGILPKISEDEEKAWQYYARPFTITGGAPLISVVVTGLGIHSELSNIATTLPPNISLSFSPYAPDVSVWMQSARAQGHEFMLDLPLQTEKFPMEDPGPAALMSNIMPEENTPRLLWTMSRAPGYIGLTMPPDEVFFAGQPDFIQPVADELATRGVMALFTHKHERPALQTILDQTRLPHLYADVHMEYGLNAAEIDSQLKSLESVAQQRGHAVLVVHASPVALQQLKKWSESVVGRGFQLAPISALARKKFS